MNPTGRRALNGNGAPLKPFAMPLPQFEHRWYEVMNDEHGRSEPQ